MCYAKYHNPQHSNEIHRLNICYIWKFTRPVNVN